jgi:hypothetical protein
MKVRKQEGRSFQTTKSPGVEWYDGGFTPAQLSRALQIDSLRGLFKNGQLRLMRSGAAMKLTCCRDAAVALHSAA